MSDVTPTSDPSCSTGVLEQCLESFTTELTSLGYCAAGVRKKRAIARAFARWAVGQGLDVATIDDATIEAFLADSEVGHPTPKSNRRCTLARFLARLRAEGATLRPELKRDHSYAALLEQRYVTYLRSERGLAEETVGSYRMWVSELVRYHFGTAARPAPASGLDARAVQGFLLERTRTLSPGTARLVATALRSFLRFLFLCGEIRLDLARAIPTVPTRRQVGTHPYLCPEEVERLLDACDRKTANGRRDHAILLLLARLGVRACEVAALELGDLRWRSAEIVVRGKGQVLEHVPLLPDVGAALALYLREGRPKSQCRSVFLRNDAPRVGLTPGGVGWVVRRALARAGLRPPRRGSHLLRFSLATTMIRRGASMAEIGEVLRHRSPETTEIYAKVDFEALRAVALPWVGTGGGR